MVEAQLADVPKVSVELREEFAAWDRACDRALNLVEGDAESKTRSTPAPSPKRRGGDPGSPPPNFGSPRVYDSQSWTPPLRFGEGVGG